ALRAAADAIEARRADLLTVMAREGGKTVAEADPEVSEAVDFARYYAQSALEITELEQAEGLTFTPSPLVLVTPPWNFPVAIGIGGVLAALAAGSAVVIKPAHPTPGCVEVAVEGIHQALAAHGVDPAVVQVVRASERTVGRHLVAHPGIDTVILTGAYETSQMFAGWRADRDGGPRVFGETSGKNALVVTPHADYDLAVADVLSSAFGHAGQKCSAASLLILVGSVATSERFRRQLVDAVSSVRVGWPVDLGTTMGPVIEVPEGKLREALTTLEPGEAWLVEPRQLDETGRLWSPGLKDGVQAGSPFHLREYFGPVLGIMTAATLAEAIALQNAVDFGLTGGLHSLDDAEITRWLERVEVGNAYVNRHTTGAIVQRQPFGGWKRSAVGPGAKAGGENYVAQLGAWTQTGETAACGELGERVKVLIPVVAALAGTPADVAWLEAAAASDAHARDSVFRIESDPDGLRAESNVLRYRPVPHVTIRAGAGATPVQVARVALAAECAGVPVTISTTPGLARAALDAVGRDSEEGRELALRGWGIATDEEFAKRIGSGEVRGRVRVIGDASALWPATVAAGADVTLLTGDVLTSGRRELLTMLREQAISRTLHRFGHLPLASH
ncbi:MAG: aldehyde dehydrogenase family protein, partial [Actinomycetales bacterium]|nr:aldehyde dehydrogenase family protein [Actinomycetales bacterium]